MVIKLLTLILVLDAIIGLKANSCFDFGSFKSSSSLNRSVTKRQFFIGRFKPAQRQLLMSHSEQPDLEIKTPTSLKRSISAWLVFLNLSQSR